MLRPQTETGILHSMRPIIWSLNICSRFHRILVDRWIYGSHIHHIQGGIIDMKSRTSNKDGVPPADQAQWCLLLSHLEEAVDAQLLVSNQVDPQVPDKHYQKTVKFCYFCLYLSVSLFVNMNGYREFCMNGVDPWVTPWAIWFNREG